jgi:hypothetical protein
LRDFDRLGCCGWRRGFRRRIVGRRIEGPEQRYSEHVAFQHEQLPRLDTRVERAGHQRFDRIRAGLDRRIQGRLRIWVRLRALLDVRFSGRLRGTIAVRRLRGHSHAQRESEQRAKNGVYA